MKGTAQHCPDDFGLDGAIVAFKQILETLPDDSHSIEALWHIYEQKDDVANAKLYLFRLARQLRKDGNRDEIRKIIDALREYAKEDPEGQSILEQLQEFD